MQPMMPQQGPQQGQPQPGPQMPPQMQGQPQMQSAAVPRIDVQEFERTVGRLADPQLKQLAQDPKYMQNAMFGPLVNAELTRRVAARQQAQAQQMPQGQQPTVVQQAQQMAQQLPEDSGIAQLPAENIANMADGGIVALAGGGLPEDEMVQYDFPDISGGVDDEILLGGNTEDPQQAWARSVLPQAKRVAERLNVPVEAVVGQWGLETGWGKSVIPGTFNLGNVTTHPKDPNAVWVKPNAARDKRPFKKYGSYDESADEFARLLETPRYKSVRGASDPEKYFSSLLASGYVGTPAEDPNYVSAGLAATKKAREYLGGQPVVASATPEAKASAHNTAATAASSPLLSVMDRIDRGESVPINLDPIGYSDMNAAQRKAARAQAQDAAAKGATSDRGSWLGLPTIWGSGAQTQFESAEKALEANRRAQAGLAPPSKEPAPPRFKDTPIPMAPEVPTRRPNAGAGATGMDFGASVSAEQALQDRQARGAELMANLGRDPLEGVMPAEAKKKALAQAKEAIPAEKRKGMSDEALLTFFLSLMGGRSKSMLRNISGAGLTALQTEQGLRKEERERLKDLADQQKDAALIKYYGQMGAAAGKPTGIAAMVDYLGKGDPELGMKRFIEIQQGKKGMTPEALMLAVGKQVDSQLQKNPALVFNTPEYNAKRSELITKEMQRLQALGVSGLEGVDTSTIGGAGGSQQVYDFTDLTRRKP